MGFGVAVVRAARSNDDSTFSFFVRSYARSLGRLQKFQNGALFLASNVGAKTHVMNDYLPLCVTMHGGRSNIVATHTIIRPKLFPAEAHVGIVRDCVARLDIRLAVCFGFRKQA